MSQYETSVRTALKGILERLPPQDAEAIRAAIELERRDAVRALWGKN